MARPPAMLASAWLGPMVLLGALGLVVGGRWVATRAGLDPLAVGLAFGVALSAVALGGVALPAVAIRLAALGGRTLGSRTPEYVLVPDGRRIAIALGVGGVFGLALVGVVVLGAAIGGATLVPGLGRPAAAILPWAAITVLVASAEEALLRGRLFDAIQRSGGILPAVILTTLAFALMHVPLYGWHVVPLDLAVGLGLGGLRIATRSVAGPAAAHSVADLATWWL